MKQRIECRSQIEVDACLAAGDIAIVIGCRVVIEASASVVAWENSSVLARGNSSVEAWGNSNVVARENSNVVARGNAFIRLFSALRIKASAWVTIIKHGTAKEIEGGRQLDAAPEPTTGAEFCDFNGIDPANVDYLVPNLDAKIIAHVEQHNHLDMSSWHGRKCDENNWCETTHCRAGFAICLAGTPGFELEKKYGPEAAGRMIYAVSCPDEPLPNFTASNESALEDMRRRAEKQAVN